MRPFQRRMRRPGTVNTTSVFIILAGLNGGCESYEPPAQPAESSASRATPHEATTAGHTTPGTTGRENKPVPAAPPPARSVPATSQPTAVEYTTPPAVTPAPSNKTALAPVPAPGVKPEERATEKPNPPTANPPAEKPAPEVSRGNTPAGNSTGGAAPGGAPSGNPAPTNPTPGNFANPGLRTARQKYEAGQLLEARNELNSLLKQESAVSAADQAEARALLSKIADETLFTPKRVKNDPLIEEYVIKPGDALITIARKYDVPAEALMVINNIKNPNAIRADQRLKAVHGPFNAKIYKSQFRLDLYAGDVYVRSYPVGLGTDGGTPEGVWKVKNRLKNPTYFPSASAPEKRIIAADDPDNPLGEYWIGLEGVSGAAVGQDGYGIHGTIEPDSVGKAVSLGCVRMHNADVEFVYGLLAPGKSTVTVLP